MKNHALLAYLLCFFAFVLLFGASWSQRLGLNLGLLAVAVLLCLFSLLVAFIGWRQAKQTPHWQMLACQDALTGLLNRRGLEVKRLPKRYCCVLIDIDRFKAINDSRGHAAGDKLLVKLAQRLKQNTRQGDWCVRWGGDEFLVVLAAADKHIGKCFIERLQSDLAQHLQADGISITAGWADNAKLKDYQAVIQQADARLINAKQAKKQPHIPIAPGY